jgi:putative spermidine/putrescine transport system permease protein
VSLRAVLGTIADRAWWALVWLLALFSLALLIVPSLIILAISLDTRSFIGFPPAGLTLDWYSAMFANRTIMSAAGVSLQVALLVTGLALALGVPAAYALVRAASPLKAAASTFATLPLMTPGVVIGLALLFTGSYLGFYSSIGLLVCGLLVFCAPMVIRVVSGRAAALDPSLEEASANLGASPGQTFRLVTLPQLATAIVAAAALVFIEAFDNIAIALFTAPVRGRPLSVELYSLVQFDATPLVAAIASAEILLAFVVVGVVSWAVGLERIAR